MDMKKKATNKFLRIEIPLLIFHSLFRVSRYFISYSDVAEDVIGIIIILGQFFALLQLKQNRT